MVEERDAISVVLLLNAYGLAVDNFMARSGYRTRVLLHSGAYAELHDFVDRCCDCLHTRALYERLELYDCRNAVPSSPGLVRDHDRVHELFRPCVLYLQGLLVLQSFRAEAAEDGDGMNGMELPVRQSEGEARSNQSSAELVVNRRATQGSSTDRGRQRAADM